MKTKKTAKKPPTPSLLECIYAISQRTEDVDMDFDDFIDEGEGKKPGKREELQDTADCFGRVKSFFGCDEWEARVLSVVVMSGFESEEFSAKGLKKKLDLPVKELPRLDRFLNTMVAKGWIGIERGAENFMSRRYVACAMLVDAVVRERKSALKRKRMEKLDAYLYDIGQVLKENVGLKADVRSLESRIGRVHRKGRHLSFVQWLDGLGLGMLEVAFVCHVVSRFMEGEDDIDANNILNMTHAGAPIERLRFRKELASGSMPVAREGVLKVDLLCNGRLLELNVTDRLLGRLEDQSDLGKTVARKVELKKLERVDPKDVVRKTLRFEGVLERSIGEFAALLEKERLDEVMERLGSKGMNRGIVALFHGGPGTGKTESVLQMSASTGREILRVNLSEIRNKYVGESEKSIRRIFEEYRSYSAGADLQPILLFNEADAVLGRRIRVNTSVDQMNNTMQNILLEELEAFDGILVATTNLALNLDPAFERRFVFKLRFENGGVDLRKSLWSGHFPDLEEETLRRLAERFDLSPAQIANVAKRHEIRGLLSGESGTDLEHLAELAEEEKLKGASEPRVIGFRTHGGA